MRHLKPEYIPNWRPTGDLQADRLSFLKEGVDFYSADPEGRRSLRPSGIGCQYRNDSGAGCFIGRHIPDSVIQLVEQREINDSSFDSLIAEEKTKGELLPLEVQALGECFLCDCQSLHDGDQMWNAGGLTQMGRDRYDVMVRAIKSEHDYLTYNGDDYVQS